MNKKDRVRLKSGVVGTVASITKDWVYVLLDGGRTAFPYKREWLTKVEEGEHEPGQSSGDAEELPEL